MDSNQPLFEFNKVKLLQSLQSFFSMTPTRYYHDFHRYLEEIKPDYVNTDETERLFMHLKGGIKFYLDNIHIQESIQYEIDTLPFSAYNSRLINDLLFYLDNKSLKMYYRIFELEKRVRELEDHLEADNRMSMPHCPPRNNVFFE